MSLVMVKRQNRIIFALQCLVEYRIRRYRALQHQCLSPASLYCRLNFSYLFIPEQPMFSAMGIKSGYSYSPAYQVPSLLKASSHRVDIFNKPVCFNQCHTHPLMIHAWTGRTHSNRKPETWSAGPRTRHISKHFRMPNKIYICSF